ncbi:MAG TPA: glycoside hydrolase family 15 protein [Cyclobacteriaceae bacterium]
MSRHTYNFGLIGNCSFTAHIGMDTNVAWMCWPRFDSSFVFGSLLDKKKGGEFSIMPDGGNSVNQIYIENTNVLCTEVENSEGKYKVTDFAPRFFQYERVYKPLMLIRKVEPISGQPLIKCQCKPVGNYGQDELSRNKGSNHVRFLGNESQIRLTTNISLSYLLDNHSFVLNETKYLVLTYGPPLEASLEYTVESFLRRTVDYWRDWTKSISIPNFYQRASIRSALVLKLHQFEDTGAIIASATTSLPESPGSGRNWDYRYCWMRDTFYTLNVFNNIGHFKELDEYFHYVVNTTVYANDRFQPLYGISGEDKLLEKELDLEGYMGNKPVRIGNQAYTHIQNDVYGQVLISLLPLYDDMRIIFTERFDSTALITKTLKMIERTMDEPDAGLWEFRNLSQYHCYTYLFHWAGSSAAVKIAKVLKNSNLEQLALKLQQKAAEKIEQCYLEKKKGYAQALGTDRMDASTLQLIMMNYLDPKSKRASDHLKALERDLKGKNGLFYRYKHADDFGKPEVTFLICAFWYVEALACVGRIKEAQENFDNLLQYSNHLGLLSEDVSESDGSQWGNFPQAYSHVGLLNAAHRISIKLDKPGFL